jgi:hypothetical protein
MMTSCHLIVFINYRDTPDGDFRLRGNSVELVQAEERDQRRFIWSMLAVLICRTLCV